MDLPPSDHSNLRIQRIDGLPTVSQAPTLGMMHGSSAAIDRVRQVAAELGERRGGLAWIYGAPGVGKRRLAYWIHRSGAHGPLWELDPLALSVQALPDTRGTVLVPNIDRAPAAAVKGLLAARRERTDRRVIVLSRAAPAAVEPRSAEHAQLRAAARGSTIEIPALRSRSVDIPQIAEAMVTAASKHFDRPARGLSPGAIARLENQDLSGNARELAAMIEVAVLRATGDLITADAFGAVMHRPRASLGRGELTIQLPGTTLREIELEALKLVLRVTRGRVVRAAELLGITRHTLRRKLDKHGIRHPKQLDTDGPSSTV